MNSAYLDGLNNTEQDAGEIRRESASRFSQKDRTQITVLAALDIAVFVFIGVYLILTGGSNPFDSIKNNAAFDPAVDYYNVSDALSSLAPRVGEADFPAGIREEMRALYAENDDTVGWLTIPGTGIDGVVLQAGDNEYYERRDFYERRDVRTRVYFADFRNTFGAGASSFSKVTILYGHHLTADERIWAELENYKDPEYYKAHPVLTFNTLYGTYQWKIFACMITSAVPEKDGGKLFYYWNPTISDAETIAYCQEALNRSWFVNPKVDIGASDKLLCLSTCDYDVSPEDIRCVVVARLVRDGESPEVDVSGVYANENRRMPQIWYDAKGIVNPYKNTPVFGE